MTHLLLTDTGTYTIDAETLAAIQRDPIEWLARAARRDRAERVEIVDFAERLARARPGA